MTDEQLIEIQTLCNTGLGTHKIANQLKLPYSDVQTIRRELYQQRNADRQRKQTAKAMKKIANYLAAQVILEETKRLEHLHANFDSMNRANAKEI
jgi:hypothetical protein